MKLAHIAAGVLAASLCAGRVSAAPSITGDYVESRSANVFVGACHHEGEIETMGRNALLAWNIEKGAFNGVDLSGIRAVAVVAGDRSLELPASRRRSVLYVSEGASAEQKTAIAALLRQQATSALGDVMSVKTAPIAFDSRGDLYRVNVPGVAALKIAKETRQLCCKQPYELWGKPFVSLQGAKAGFCVSAEYRDSSLVQAWNATEQNNAYFGRFSL